MELEKKDTCMVHGVAIWAMILLLLPLYGCLKIICNLLRISQSLY